MRKQLTTEDELKNLVGTQYVFTEVLPQGDDFELFKKTYKITIDKSELPRNFIVSSKGELIKDFSMTGPQNLGAILKEGIDKTGGLKGAAGYRERLEKSLEAVSAAEQQLSSSQDPLEPLGTLIEMDRTTGKQVSQVRKAIRSIFKTYENDPEKKPLLIQARMLDTGGQLAEQSKSKRAIEMYQRIVAKFPDSPGAKIAAERIAQLERGDEPEEAQPAKAENDEQQAVSEENG